jgi:hypothetical protein
MSLPEGVHQATAIAANEVLIEWLDAVIADPAAAAAELGTTYQDYLSPDSLSEADARRLLGDVAAWDPGTDDGTHAGAVQRYAQAQFAAAMDIARALIAWATDVGDVPPAVAPYATALAPLVDVIQGAIDEGGLDEEEIDLDAILGGPAIY